MRNCGDATDPSIELCASVFDYSLIVPDLKCVVHGYGNDSSNDEESGSENVLGLVLEEHVHYVLRSYKRVVCPNYRKLRVDLLRGI